MNGKYSVEGLMAEIVKLQPEEFFGICKILGVQVIKGEDEPKEAADLFGEVLEKLEKLSRVRRKNLLKLLRAANKDR